MIAYISHVFISLVLFFLASALCRENIYLLVFVFSVWHYLLSISVHHHNLMAPMAAGEPFTYVCLAICLSEIHLTSHDQCLENSSPRRWMSSTPPAAHVCTLKRQGESNLNLQTESPDHKRHDLSSEGNYYQAVAVCLFFFF